MATKKTQSTPTKAQVMWCPFGDCDARTLHAMGKNGYRLSAVDQTSGMVYFRLEAGFVDNDPPAPEAYIHRPE